MTHPWPGREGSARRGLSSSTLSSRGVAGVGGNDTSWSPRVSDDGRCALFRSLASALIAGDTNGAFDVFRRDRVLGVTQRVSVSQTDGQLVRYSGWPQLSADGRQVALMSADSEVVSPDVNTSPNQPDEFVRDMLHADQRTCVPCFGRSPTAERRCVVVRVHERRALRRVHEPSRVLRAHGLDPLARPTRRHDDARGAGSKALPRRALARRRPVRHSRSRRFHQRVEALHAREFAPPAPQTYCTAEINSLGCAPTIGSSGASSLSSELAFTITASAILNQKSGLLCYGSLASSAPYQRGTLCVAQPVRRAPRELSNGSASGADCSGAFSHDFNARILGGLDPTLVPGVTVRCQHWSRVSQTSFGTRLTDTLEFEISC